MARKTLIPFGPQHPVLPEPIQLRLVLEDEKGLIQKAVVEEKFPSAAEEELPVLKVRLG